MTKWVLGALAVVVGATALIAIMWTGDGDDAPRPRPRESVLDRARRTAPCPNQRCREVPDGLHGVSLGMTSESVSRALDDVTSFERCGLHLGKAEIGGEPAACTAELAGDPQKVIAIACSLDARRSEEHHKAVGWGLYQILARQYGLASELKDMLMPTGSLIATWAVAERTLSLQLSIPEDGVSIIRLTVTTPKAECVTIYTSPRLVDPIVRVPEGGYPVAPAPDGAAYDPERMAAKAREYLRDLTGPLEGEGP